MTDPEMLSWLREAITWWLDYARQNAARRPITPMRSHEMRGLIARCEAELAILDEHYILFNGDRNEKYEQYSIMPPPFPPEDCGCVTCHYASRGGVNGYGICRTVRILAAGYRHHPGWAEAGWAS